MILQVVFENNLVNKSGVAFPVILFLRLRQRDVELKVREFFFDLLELLLVENFTLRTRPVPECYRSVDFLGLEQMEDMRAHRRHTGAAADKHFFVRSILHEEFAVGSRNRHLVARLARENIRRTNSRVHLHKSPCGPIPGRRGDTDIQHDDIPFGRMVGHRISAERRLRIFRNQPPHLHVIPVLMVFLFDVEIAELDLVVFRNVDLDITARAEFQMFAFGQLHDELLDKGGHVVVRHHFALPFFNAQDSFGHLDLQVFLHFYLASEAPLLGLLLTGEKVHLGR